MPPFKGFVPKNKNKIFYQKGRKSEGKRGCAEGCGNVVNPAGFPSFPCPAVSELYVDSDTSEIHNRLVYAAQRQLFAVLIGDAGTGKTTALRKLKETLDGTEYAVLYLTDSKLTPRHFYNGLLEQLGLETWFYRSSE